MTKVSNLNKLIKRHAEELGFTACGIAKAEAISFEIRNKFNEWINNGKHGEMAYMAANLDKRMNPTLLVEGCKSIIVVAQNYYPDTENPYISRYAQGKDYHRVVKDKLFQLFNYINQQTPIKGRVFCDSAPVLERYWAIKSGLGWCGKNNQLIIPKAGTHFFLGELFINIELEYDKPFTDKFCGKCRACIENCPTGALTDNGLDARRCLSYLTIEYRGELPSNIIQKLNDGFYGCDKCQKICPHNKFAQPNNEKQFSPSEELLAMQPDDWHKLTKEQFDRLFKDSAIQRCGYERLMRNIKASNIK